VLCLLAHEEAVAKAVVVEAINVENVEIIIVVIVITGDVQRDDVKVRSTKYGLFWHQNILFRSAQNAKIVAIIVFVLIEEVLKVTINEAVPKVSMVC